MRSQRIKTKFLGILNQPMLFRRILGIQRAPSGVVFFTFNWVLTSKVTGKNNFDMNISMVLITNLQ